MAETSDLDFTELTYEQLKAAREDINQRLRDLEKAAIATLESQALQFGFQLIKNGLGLKTKPKVRYVNPDDPSETYAGRGKHPAWLAAKLAEGASLDEFRA